MELKFIYTEQAFIDYQLYLAANSEVVTKRRNKNRIMIALVYLGIGLTGLISNNYILLAAFAALALVWYIVYPLWSGKFYKSNFIKYVKKHNAQRIGKPVTIRFFDQKFQAEESGQKGDIPYSEFAEIIDIRSLYLIKLKTEMVILIDKENDYNASSLDQYLNDLATKLNIPFRRDLEWSFK